MTSWALVIIGATLFVAYANGANDNFKGVATLFGSGITDYRAALCWATATTVAGSLAAFFLANRLIHVFQGNGLVPAAMLQSPPFLAAVIFGAAVTVFAATQVGMPISTTHGLTGAWMGGAIAAGGINFLPLLQSFFLPLLVSPLIAVVLSFVTYSIVRAGLRRVGVNKETCVCIGNEMLPATVAGQGMALAARSSSLRVIVDQEAHCVNRFTGSVWGVSTQSLMDSGHFLSAGAVSFARGLNDTPKIVAIGLTATALEITWAVGFVAFMMALGGLVSARKVAETVSKRITAMEPEQGFSANLVTGFLVIVASGWGLPVSTTHVSCGALFGIGVANGQARSKVIQTIVMAWLLTLPMAALSAGLIYAVLHQWR
ncbi:MAG TPA: anion permease [Candidatus Binatia bacterium]|nr:anion permease [Candidatus Binatia bacterium]